MPVKELRNRDAVTHASEVKPHKIPTWLMKILRVVYPQGGLRSSYQAKLNALATLLGSVHLDHWGITDWHEVKSCFVTEPYGVNEVGLQDLKEKGRRLGFAVVYDELSFHNPGNCQRVLIFPTDISPLQDYHPAVLAALQEAGCEIAGGAPQVKKMTVLREKPGDRDAFLQFISSVGMGTQYFFNHRDVIVEKEGAGFIFHCLKKDQSKLKTDLAPSRKRCRDSRRIHPEVKIIPIRNDQLIQSSDHRYEGNEDFYVDALLRADVLAFKCDRIETMLKAALGSRVLRMSRGPLNVHKEHDIKAELAEPISSKLAMELFKQMTPPFSKRDDSGCFELPD
ncbi:MAG: hypothetical protein WC028_27850 [Candidatus Obscuribacterales bacterium]|jgi:hypothetical protein|nr:hypothetical protein [Cyanobacteriota bacterium erpe_2018_sw_21hr_WHONDRS-SW48-000092_B_bin.40]